MIAELLGRDAFGRAVQHVLIEADALPIILKRAGRHHAVIGDGGARVVELRDQAVVDDLLVFDMHRLADGFGQILVALVVFVLAVGNDRGRRRHRQETLDHLHRLQRRLEVVDVLLEQSLPGVFDRRDRDRIGDRLDVVLGIEHLVEVGEALAVGALGERVAGGRVERPPLEPGNPLDDVLRPGNALAELAVADHVDADLGLLADHLGDRLLEVRGVRRGVIALALLLGAQMLPDRLRADQAADVGGENSVGAAVHGVPPGVRFAVIVIRSRRACKRG